MTETYTAEDFVKATGGAILHPYSESASLHSETSMSVPTRSGEFERFADLASKLVAVPKTEIDEAERQA